MTPDGTPPALASAAPDADPADRVDPAEVDRRLKGPAGAPAKLGLALGAAEESLSIVALETFLLFYYTQVVGLSGSLAGAALMIALLADAVVDPALGVWSDRLRHAPFGRRHTIMIGALGPLALASILLFAAPAGLGPTAAFLYLTGWCFVMRAAISGISVPLYAIGVELSRDPTERTTLLSLRTVGGGIGRLLAVYTASSFIFRATPAYPNGRLNPSAYRGYGVYVAALGVLLAIACVAGTYRRIRSVERLEADRPAPPTRLLDFFGELLRAFRITFNLRVAYFVSSFGYVVMALISTLKLYLATYFWRITPEDTSLVLLAVALGMLVGAPLARPIVRRLDRKRALLAGVTGFVVSNLLSVALPALGLFPEPGTRALFRDVIALQCLSGAFFGLFVVAGGSITADIADEHEANTGKPQQGLVQGLLFFSIKLGSALAGIVAGVTLDLIHFPRHVDTVAPGIVQRLAVVTALVLLAAGVVVTTAASRYDISAAKQREVTRRLAIAKAGA